MLPTVKFLIFVAFSTASLVLGYVSRRRNWFHEDVSRRLHFHTIVWIWTIVFAFSIWKLPITTEALWLVVVELILVAGVGLAVIPLARMIGCDRRQVGVMAVASGVANIGITLGAFLVICLVRPVEEGRAYAMAMTAVMQVLAIVVMYPVCVHFATGTAARRSPLRLILGTFIDVRSMPLAGSALGLTLAILDAPYPAWVDDHAVLDILFYLACFSTYVGIGMRLYLGDSLRFWRQHLLLAGVRFGLVPLVVWSVILFSGWTLMPIGPTLRDVLLIQAFMPSAVMTVMLANLFHLDVRLACVAWLWNTILFLLVPLPILLFLMR